MKVEVFQGEDGQWYVRLLARNRQTLMVSEGYINKASATRLAGRVFPELPLTVIE